MDRCTNLEMDRSTNLRMDAHKPVKASKISQGLSPDVSLPKFSPKHSLQELSSKRFVPKVSFQTFLSLARFVTRHFAPKVFFQKFQSFFPKVGESRNVSQNFLLFKDWSPNTSLRMFLSKDFFLKRFSPKVPLQKFLSKSCSQSSSKSFRPFFFYAWSPQVSFPNLFFQRVSPAFPKVYFARLGTKHSSHPRSVLASLVAKLHFSIRACHPRSDQDSSRHMDTGMHKPVKEQVNK